MPQTYFAILTATGEAKDANAKALGVPLVLTEMAVGDGNGNLPVPDRTRTTLVNQVRRAPLNQLSRDPINTNQVIAEQVIPENVGGWWIREFGLYDADGDLIAIGNCPPTYKPQLAEGSGRTQVIRMILIMSSVDNVQVKIDPAVVLATRKYADDAITASMAAHVAAADPHAQYVQKTRGIGEYDAAKAYTIGARVIGDDGKTYKCIQAGTGKTPSTQPAFWEIWGYSKSELKAVIGQQSGGAVVKGLRGYNVVGQPSQYMLSADSVTLRNPATGETITKTNTGNLLVDVALAGPAAGGRDQAAAYGAAGYMHICLIYNPTTDTLSTINQIVIGTNPVAPVFPAGFTHFAYATTLRLSGSTTITAMTVRGAKVYYNLDTAGTRVLSAGTNTSLTYVNVPTGTYIPPNVLRGILRGELHASNTVVASTVGLLIKTLERARTIAGGSVQNTAVTDLMVGEVETELNADGSFGYRASAVASLAVNFDVMGYVVPNGDC